jgi:tRNA-2-methylthio-N6-dimethylallyladenosine synthase
VESQKQKPRRYLIRTFGCQMNEHDSERLAGLLEADGMVPADRLDEADVVVLNTCCIRENADNKLYGHLGHLKAVKARRPELQIAVGGCLAQKDQHLIQERAPWVDAVFGTHNVGHATDLLTRSMTEGPVMEILEAAQLEEDSAFPSALPVRRELAHAAWVTIQIGCDNRCAFCIVPSVRGKEISRPFGQITAEVEQLAAAGTVEVTLLGQNVNSYGRDLTTALRTDRQWRGASQQTGPAWTADDRPRARPLFADLLRTVARVEGIRRVRYTSPHPKDLRPETIEVMASEPAVCEHLHLPLQAGSDRTLAAMHRGYTAERYLDRLAAARAAVPDLAVTTDLIVGFPGETDDDFERTLEVVAEAGYDSAYTFIFSPRPGTEAARADDFVAPEVVADRFARLKVTVERSALAKHEARVGEIEEVLVEGPSKRDSKMTSGRTRHNKLVHFAAQLQAGTFADVRITQAAPHYLMGELQQVTATPRHKPAKTRIPLVAV